MSTLLELAENVRGLNGQVIILEDSDVVWVKPKHVGRARQALLKRFANVSFKRKLPNSEGYEVWDIRGNTHYEVIAGAFLGNTYSHIVFDGGNCLSSHITTEISHPASSKP